MKKIHVTFIMLALVTAANAQSGTLDPSFGSGGIVISHIAKSNAIAAAVIIQSDGRILVGGTCADSSMVTTPDFLLVRYDEDGSLDKTFGSGGIIQTPTKNLYGTGYGSSVVIAPNGKIVMAGISGDSFAVVRYNANGILDNSFGSSGMVETAVESPYGYSNAMVIQSNGKIVVAGSSLHGMSSDFVLVCYNANGSLDKTFGSNGMVITDFGNSDDHANSIAIQPDGKIIVAGTTWNGSFSKFALARYNADGSLDPAFSGGKVTIGLQNTNDDGESVVLQPDGKIVVGGFNYNGHSDRFALARLNSNGDPDFTFGSGGNAIGNVNGYYCYGYSLAVQSDGKILIAGNGYSQNSEEKMILARFTANGNLDAAFGSGGVSFLEIGSEILCRGVILQNDNKLVVVGHTSDGNNWDIAMARYLNDIVNSVPDISTCNQLNLFPNPFTDEITVKGIQGKGEVLIFDECGKLVAFGDEKINTAKLPGGFYLIYYADGNDRKKYISKAVKY